MRMLPESLRQRQDIGFSVIGKGIVACVLDIVEIPTKNFGAPSCGHQGMGAPTPQHPQSQHPQIPTTSLLSYRIFSMLQHLCQGYVTFNVLVNQYWRYYMPVEAHEHQKFLDKHF